MISSSGHRTSSGSGLHIFQTSIIYFLFEKKYLIFSFSKTSDIYAIEVLLIALRHQIFKLIASQHFQFRIVISLAKRTGTYTGKLNHTPQDKAIQNIVGKHHKPKYKIL